MMQYIAHHGIKGQKWGIRRYQNEDGSLTTLGRIHYGYDSSGKRVVTYVRGKEVDRPTLTGYRQYVASQGGRKVQREAKRNIKDKQLYNTVKKILWGKPINDVDQEIVNEGRKWLDKAQGTLYRYDDVKKEYWYTNMIADLDTWLNANKEYNTFSMTPEEAKRFKKEQEELVKDFKRKRAFRYDY